MTKRVFNETHTNRQMTAIFLGTICIAAAEEEEEAEGKTVL